MANLINRSAVKKFVLEHAKITRSGWECKRVSKEYLDNLEARVRLLIEKDVHQHPTLGKTFRP